MVRELTLELENKIILVNVELKLIRKIPRWDLRNPSIYSNAVVYDCTARARGNLYQILHFHLRNEFQSRFLFIPNYLRDNTFLAVEPSKKLVLTKNCVIDPVKRKKLPKRGEEWAELLSFYSNSRSTVDGGTVLSFYRPRFQGCRCLSI